ncbi:MAG: GNAT family N-acetyltransferase [Sphingomonadaceae bacterium]|nr:GNAT family N-acetyltransferase [Sphingomonadaceae bacterium]
MNNIDVRTAVRYRDVTPADAAELARIGRDTFVETFGHLYSAADLDAFIESDHSEAACRALLAKPGVAARFVETGGAVRGYGVVAPNALPFVPEGVPTLELKRLYLTAALRGQGVADALMDWAESHARRAGAQAVTLSVFSDNHRAKRFYARRGYTHLGDYHFMVGSQADAEHVWWRLL